MLADKTHVLQLQLTGYRSVTDCNRPYPIRVGNIVGVLNHYRRSSESTICKCGVNNDQLQMRMAAEAAMLDIRIQPPNFEEEALV
jgi:hypothetical protein